MLVAWVEWLGTMMNHLGPWGVAMAMALECAGLPVPSEPILLVGGFLASRGRATVLGVTLAAAGGGLVGSFALYAAARWGGRPFLIRVSQGLGLTVLDWRRAEDWFTAGGEWAVFACRMVPGLRTLVSIPAGAAAMPAGRFLWLTFLGSLPWCFALVLGGYLLGERWAEMQPRLAELGRWFVGLMALGGLSWWWWRRARS